MASNSYGESYCGWLVSTPPYLWLFIVGMPLVWFHGVFGGSLVSAQLELKRSIMQSAIYPWLSPRRVHGWVWHHSWLAMLHSRLPALGYLCESNGRVVNTWAVGTEVQLVIDQAVDAQRFHERKTQELSPLVFSHQD